MKTPRSFRSALLALALALPALPCARAQNDLLLPFPEGSAAETSDVAVRESLPTAENEKHRQAIEIAETFIRRQQMEVASSVPRRGEPTPRVQARPLPATTPMPVIAAAPTFLSAPVSGPQSELLPMPPEGNWGDPAMLPDGEGNGFLSLPEGTSPPETSSASTDAVPRSALSSAPAYGDLADQERRGQLFRIPGDEAYAVAKARGFKFTPAGGMGARDGSRTAASQFPDMITSEVNGPLMAQARPPRAWELGESANTFFMFCDAGYKAVPLNPGWRIRGIALDGPNWRWVACPRSGAGTASFSVRLYSYRDAQANTAVKLTRLTLEGPPGATDWKQAFPYLNGKGPRPAPAPESSAPGAPVVASSTAPELPR